MGYGSKNECAERWTRRRKDRGNIVDKKKIILLAEDNPVFEELSVYALEGSGVADGVVVARDGAEALDYLFCEGAHDGRDDGAVPMVILLDMVMPRLGGLEVLEAIRSDERTRLLPVVMFSSSDEPQDLIDAYALGANSYVAKTSSDEPFSELVLRIARYWLEVNRHPPKLGRGAR